MPAGKIIESSTYVPIRVAAVPLVALLLFVFCLDVNGQNSPSEKNGTADLFGAVKNAGSIPIVLHLRALDENPVRYYDGYEERTATDGSFHFAGIAPGRYRLETGGSGFRLPAPLTLSLRAGERRKGLDIAVVPSFSLCGHVTENGAPVKGAWVTAYRYNPEYGTFSELRVPATRPDGSFLIPDVEAGMYYLAGGSTYYPGTYRFHEAKPITVGAGIGAGCSLEIPLQPAWCGPVSKVSGQIVAMPGDANAKYRVMFLEANPSGGAMPEGTGALYKPGDTFELSVCPGSYDLVLTDEQPIAPWQGRPTHKVVFDSRHIEVGAAAIEGIQLMPRTMASISGEVRGITRGVSCPGSGQRMRVSILRDGDGQYQTAELDDENRFSFRNVAPGEYSVYAGPVAREAFYLESILVDGMPVTGRRFTVAGAQPTAMAIRLSNDLTKAAGRLSPDLRGEPRWELGWTRPKGSVAGTISNAGQSRMTLKLRAARYNSNRSREYVTQATEGGGFRFDGVDPGVYTLRAEGAGFVTQEYGARGAGRRGIPIVVRRGGNIRGLKLAAIRLSAICGTVTNSEGVPVADTPIFLKRDDGGSVYRGPSEVRTNAAGRFRMEGITPGQYLLTLRDVYRTVFFSRDGTFAAATPMPVQAGSDVGCDASTELRLRVPSDYRATYSFSGKVSGDLPATEGDRFWVELNDVNASGAEIPVARAKLDSERRFSFTGVPGGRFRLQLNSAFGPEPRGWSGLRFWMAFHRLASQAIDVRKGMPEVTVMPIPLARVSGTVRFELLREAWRQHFDITQERITLAPRDRRRAMSVQLTGDGTFPVTPVDAGEYEVMPFSLATLYIKSVRVDGREIKGRYFRLDAGRSVRLEVGASGESGEAVVDVTPDQSLPMAEPFIKGTCTWALEPEYNVLLFPDPLFIVSAEGGAPGSVALTERRLLSGGAYYGETRCRIYGIPPGRYRALAMQSPRMTERIGFRPRLYSIEERHRVVAGVLAQLGQPVEVPAGGTFELALPDRTIDVLRAAAATGIPLDEGLLDR